MADEFLIPEVTSTRIILPFHTVAYIVKFEQGKPFYLLLRRCGDYLSGNWQMVSGGIENGETAWQAAFREVKEETNLIPDRFYTADIVESFYEVLWDSIVMAPVFLAFIDTPQHVKLSPTEHDEYRWVSYEEACQTLEFSDQRRIIKHIEENFIKKSPNERFRIHCAEPCFSTANT